MLKTFLRMLSVLLSALYPPAPLNSLTFWRNTNEIIIIIIKGKNYGAY